MLQELLKIYKESGFIPEGEWSRVRFLIRKMGDYTANIPELGLDCQLQNTDWDPDNKDGLLIPIGEVSSEKGKQTPPSIKINLRELSIEKTDVGASLIAGEAQINILSPNQEVPTPAMRSTYRTSRSPFCC